MFIAADAAEGASERTLEWYRMITGRAVPRLASDRPVDRIGAAELRVWLLELRETLAPESIAGYVCGLKAFGNWCNAEELAAAPGFRALRRPHLPRKINRARPRSPMSSRVADSGPHPGLVDASGRISESAFAMTLSR